MPDDLAIHDRLHIPGSLLSLRFTRSGGPGGQHVNTSDTGVILRFALERCTVLHPSVKQRIQEARRSAVTSEGDFIIRADRHRSQTQNIEEARKRLAEIIRANLYPPKPRRPTKPTRASKKRRVEAKKRRGSVKQNRGKVRRDD
jgi:ribosome-associated protein